MTPLAALEPYSAVAEASFSTSIDWISEGLISERAFWIAVPPTLPVNTGTPSTTMSGFELDVIELNPLIRITGGLLSTPLGIVIETPAAFPDNA